MTWEKQGLIYQPDKSIGQFSHAQMPKGVQISEDVLRIFYTSRDKKGRSLPYYIDVSTLDLSSVIYVDPIPLLDLGGEDDFDRDGVMVSDVEWNRYNDTWTMTYIGWRTGGSVPYETKIGFAAGHIDDMQKGGEISLRPEGFNKTTAVTCKDPSIMEYAVFSHWIDNKEPVYRLLSPLVSESQCTCAPSFIYNQDTDDVEMFFSVREVTDYRYNRKNSYRILKSRATEDFMFTYHSGIEPSNDVNDFDYDMICYADVLFLNNRYIMLYNGNEFGKYGFGWASCSIL